MKISGLRKLIFIVMAITFLFQFGCQKKVEKVEEERKNPVRLSAVKDGEINKDIAFTGTVRSRDIVEILPKISGRVESVYVREGDKVKKGQVIIQQDNADWKAQLAQARASLQAAQAQVSQAQSGYNVTASTTDAQVLVSRQGVDQAEEAVEQAKSSFRNIQLEYDRMKNLYSRGAVSRQDLDQATTQYEIGKSQVDAAVSRLQQSKESLKLSRANTGQADVQKSMVQTAVAGVAQAQANIDYINVMIGYTTIRSPINGVITARNTEPGQIIAPGDKTPSLIITDNSLVYVEADIPESDVAGMNVMENVKVTVPSLNNKEFKGKIKTIIPSADSMSKTFRVKIAVRNPDGILKNGMSAVSEAQIATYKGIVIPRHWLIQIEGEYYLCVVSDEGKLKQKKVKAGYMNEELAQIKEGAKVGDEVISTGHENLKDGDVVEVKGYDDKGDNSKKPEIIKGETP